MPGLVKKLGVVVVAVFAFARVAAADSVTLTLNGGSGAGTGTFGCTGTNGCFGNALTLNVSGSGTTWTVTFSINTTGNTNPGTGIAAVSWVLTGFNYGPGVSLTSTSAGPLSDWSTSSGPANANGCGGVSANSSCSMDVVGGLNASPLGGPTYTWTWTISGQTFGGFDANTHIQVLFASGGATLTSKGYDFPGTGLISTHTAVPEPGTMLLLGAGLLGLGALRRRLV